MKRIQGLLLCILPVCVMAQENKNTPSYPQTYFRNPLDIPIFLAGNFGECRPGHFHSGMDIKTLGKENQPVHAAADGYISRIKMEKGGFGHGIYITHPNGYTTLYAHLNDFAPAIQQYVKEQQYAQQRWDVDLTLSPTQFPVKKGQQIAWSGNTGASTAPHLHFEIRDTKTEHPLNGEQFGLPVIDKIAPAPTAIAFYDNNTSIYEQKPVIASLKKKGTTYMLTNAANVIEINAGTAGIGLNVDDFMNGSTNTIAFYTAQLYMDDQLQASVKLDDIGYDETRYINAYADYKTKEQTGKWVQCLFKLPGNHLDAIYPFLNDKNGGLDISDKQPHKIKIVVTDDRKNVATISFNVRSKNIDAPAPKDCRLFKANKPASFTNPNIELNLDEKVLYDDICFRYSATADANAFSDRYQLHFSYVPMHHSVTLKIKPNKPIPFNLRDKVALLYTDGKDQSGTAATYTDQGWYSTSIRDFGTYWLAADTVAPVIKPMQKEGEDMSAAKQITFMVKDNLTSVKTFSGYIDGNWVSFEQHGSLFFYKFDEHCPPGRHKLEFKAADENNNTANFVLNFTR